MQDHINVSGVLCSSYDTFFEAEKKIADYILEHKSEIIDMTVAELALASGTSDATVSRFCRRCSGEGGGGGTREFRGGIQRYQPRKYRTVPSEHPGQQGGGADTDSVHDGPGSAGKDPGTD